MSVSRKLAVLLTTTAIVGGGRAYAQDINPGPGMVEVTVIPGGSMYFTDHNRATPFTNYNLGAALTYNINRIVGIEGEVGGSLGVTQTLRIGGVSTSGLKPPDMLDYAGNVVVSVPSGTSLVPYAAAGIGGLSIFQRQAVGVLSTDTFLTGNVGGGVKWYAPNGRWGLRGDYRFVATRSNATASPFFGPSDRFAHRVYGAVVINAVR
jgi:hypothetical protein